MTQRLGALSRVVLYPETAWGADPGSPVGYVLPLAAQTSYKTAQGLIEAPYYSGDRAPFGAVLGNAEASGRIDLGLEFLTVGQIVDLLMGHGAYARPFGGATTLHRWPLGAGTAANPGSCQLQMESLETPTQYLRTKGNRVGSMNFAFSTEGVARYGCEFIGNGDEALTNLAGTITNNGYVGESYFNGQFFLGSQRISTLTEFQLDILSQLSRTNVAFNNGIAAAITAGNLQITGHLAMLYKAGGSGYEEDMAFYEAAKNQEVLGLDCLWADKPLPLATQYLRIIVPAVRFGKSSFMPGGNAGLIVSQGYRTINDPTNSKIAAERWGTVKGPYTIVLTTADKFPVKIDGGGTITVTLAAGSKTTDQIVTALNADGAFSAAAVADNFLGGVRVTSKTKGSTSSVQFDTAVSGHVGTLMGFDNVAATGYNTAIMVEVYNTKATDY